MESACDLWRVADLFDQLRLDWRLPILNVLVVARGIPSSALRRLRCSSVNCVVVYFLLTFILKKYEPPDNSASSSPVNQEPFRAGRIAFFDRCDRFVYATQVL